MLPDGGFSLTPGGAYRPDATCWAILALLADPESSDLLARARDRLAMDQLSDGRVGISADHPEVIWPTSLAIFAWQQSEAHRLNQQRAADFLLGSSSLHKPREKDSPSADDSSIRGWTWIDGTYPWVEPTALAMMALEVAGYGDHDRVREGARLILNRQLPQGGWNYGNTVVYDQTLRPMPVSTGIALNALKGHCQMETIRQSLAYMKVRVGGLQTPRSLGWGLLGLGAWQARPENGPALIDVCLKNQDRYGVYDTVSLSLLLVAAASAGGLEDIFRDAGKP